MTALTMQNSFQGMVLQWQDLFYQKRYSVRRTDRHSADPAAH